LRDGGPPPKIRLTVSPHDSRISGDQRTHPDPVELPALDHGSQNVNLHTLGDADPDDPFGKPRLVGVAAAHEPGQLDVDKTFVGACGRAEYGIGKANFETRARSVGIEKTDGFGFLEGAACESRK
jgi:hypothetical protein